MERNKWKLKPFKVLKIKVYEETLKRYQQVLTIQGKTMQEDIEQHIQNKLK